MPRAEPERGFAADLAAARTGDRVALERILKTVETALERVAARRLGVRLKARTRVSDVVQSVLLEIIQSLDSFDGPDSSAFEAWSVTVLENHIRRQDRFFRAKKRAAPSRTSQKQVMEKARARPVATPSAEVARAEDMALVTEAVKLLSEDHRAVIRHSVIEGRSHRDVATIIGRSEQATRMLLCRARAALSLAIEEVESGRKSRGRGAAR